MRGEMDSLPPTLLDRIPAELIDVITELSRTESLLAMRKARYISEQDFQLEMYAVCKRNRRKKNEKLLATYDPNCDYYLLRLALTMRRKGTSARLSNAATQSELLLSSLPFLEKASGNGFLDFLRKMITHLPLHLSLALLPKVASLTTKLSDKNINTILSAELRAVISASFSRHPLNEEILSMCSSDRSLSRVMMSAAAASNPYMILLLLKKFLHAYGAIMDAKSAVMIVDGMANWDRYPALCQLLLSSVPIAELSKNKMGAGILVAALDGFRLITTSSLPSVTKAAILKHATKQYRYDVITFEKASEMLLYMLAQPEGCYADAASHAFLFISDSKRFRQEALLPLLLPCLFDRDKVNALATLSHERLFFVIRW